MFIAQTLLRFLIHWELWSVILDKCRCIYKMTSHKKVEKFPGKYRIKYRHSFFSCKIGRKNIETKKPRLSKKDFFSLKS